MVGYKRTDADTAENVDIFSSLLGCPEVRAIPPQHMYNADEMGFGANGLMFGDAYRQEIMSGTRDEQSGSVLECISAAGRVIPPLVIFAGEDLYLDMSPGDDLSRYKDWAFGASTNGCWDDADVALRWLTTIFCPRTQPDDPEQWRLLILPDRHKSHTLPSFISKCISNKIWIAFLPASASHVLQPCELGFFASMKPEYHSKLRTACKVHRESHARNPEFLNAYSRVREKAAKVRQIKAGWATSGAFPRTRKASGSQKVRGAGESRVAGASAVGSSVLDRATTPDFDADLSPNSGDDEDIEDRSVISGPR